MPSSPFSVRLDDDIRAKLKKTADTLKRSESSVVQIAVERFIDQEEEMIRLMRERMKDADSGELVSAEAVNAWIASWSTENPLPKPEVDTIIKKS